MAEEVIPFYGAELPRLFEIERRCMDRDQVVPRFLDRILPKGRVLDIGAGNGFTAGLLASEGRDEMANSQRSAYFFDRSKLCSYDVRSRRLNWQVAAPTGIAPYPVGYRPIAVNLAEASDVPPRSLGSYSHSYSQRVHRAVGGHSGLLPGASALVLAPLLIP